MAKGISLGRAARRVQTLFSQTEGHITYRIWSVFWTLFGTVKAAIAAGIFVATSIAGFAQNAQVFEVIPAALVAAAAVLWLYNEYTRRKGMMRLTAGDAAAVPKLADTDTGRRPWGTSNPAGFSTKPVATTEELASGRIAGRCVYSRDVPLEDHLAIHHKTFIDCDFIGPGVFFCVQTNMNDCVFTLQGADKEAMLWPWGADKPAGIGPTVLHQCDFRRCRFILCGFTGGTEMLNSIRSIPFGS